MAVTDIEFEYIQTNGIQLHVAVSGPEDGELVVLLHGFPEFWFSWRKQIRVLAGAGYRVVAPDQRGYNKSDKPEGKNAYSINKLEQDIAGLIEYYGYDNAAVIGHDWGGGVAWQLAGTHPEKVNRLVVLNMPHPAAFPKVLAKTPSQGLRSSYMLFFQIPMLPEKIMSSKDYAYMAQALVQTSRKGTFTEDDLDAYRIAWARPRALTSMLNWYRALPANMKHIPKHTIEMPVKIIWGTGDQFLSKKLAEESLKYASSSSVEWVEEGTHWVHQEQPEYVNEQILQFLDS
ncbi:alpha/beta hydrolase [Salinicoccus cyprini]|uniref:Alpha/beta hydrolase n=1 Tax=Salinicoccus cyprini TaxID=2493691 RepID=A0A558AVF1_9STAP|nr:alpha/beta hydrolase [Salinicoccus cyprini]TVT28244.1 alpha/beta hydrolase [Salinicoccus cyprini]